MAAGGQGTILYRERSSPGDRGTVCRATERGHRAGVRACRRRNRNLNRRRVAGRSSPGSGNRFPRAIQSCLGLYTRESRPLLQAYGKNRLVTSLIHLLRRPRLLIYRPTGHSHFFRPVAGGACACPCACAIVDHGSWIVIVPD